MDTAERRLELARFLRTRRARLLPAEVGLPPGRRRRTCGLRREEVAAIAGLSVTWYTRLEQGRTAGVSSHALDAIARALRLSPAERAHLLQLARHQPSTEILELNLSPALQAAVLLCDAYPAALLNDRWDVLLRNRAARVVFGEPTEAPDGCPNVLWGMFTDVRLMRLLVNWELYAQGMLAAFRASYAYHAGEERYVELVEALCERSAHFARWWESYDLLERGEWSGVLNHQEVGELLLGTVVFVPDGRPELRLVLTTPERGSPSVAKLTRLLSTAAGEAAAG